MIVSKVHRLRADKEMKEGRKLTLAVMSQETRLGTATLQRLFDVDSQAVERIDGKTMSALCKYFQVGVGDLLEYRPDEEDDHE